MRKKISIICIIIILPICICYLFISNQNKNKLYLSSKNITITLEDIESIDIYNIPASTGSEKSIKELSGLYLYSIYPKKVEYKNEFVLWKGNKFSIINFKNGDKIKIKYSDYGDFFSIIGEQGYYLFE